MFWILLPALLFFLGFVLTFAVGSFIPHTTNMCVVDVERNIDQCFALANRFELYPKYLKDITSLDCEGGDFSKLGARGSITLGSTQYPFEVIEFIPNYRVALRHRGELDHWRFQLSFYRLSRNSSRIVLLARVASDSRFRRAANAFKRKQRDRYFNQLLGAAKRCTESEPQVETTYPDVSPEQNPNFSLN